MIEFDYENSLFHLFPPLIPLQPTKDANQKIKTTGEARGGAGGHTSPLLALGDACDATPCRIPHRLVLSFSLKTSNTLKKLSY